MDDISLGEAGNDAAFNNEGQHEEGTKVNKTEGNKQYLDSSNAYSRVVNDDELEGKVYHSKDI